jgi:hypothetical protein
MEAVGTEALMSALDMLRAFARENAAQSIPEYEINERNEKTQPKDDVTPQVSRDAWDNSFNSFLSLSEKDKTDLGLANLEERAAIIECGAGVPRTWAEGYAALSMMPPPVGFTPERWRRIVDAAGIFIDRWAAKAAGCGWSATDVFGCHPSAPDARFDAMGLVLMLDRAEVVDVDPDGADLMARAGGVRTRYYRRPLPPETISLWEIAVTTTGHDP